jgi:hypothetical protein
VWQVSQLRDDFLDVADDEQPVTAFEPPASALAMGSHDAASVPDAAAAAAPGGGPAGGGGPRSATDGPLEGAGVVRSGQGAGQGAGQWLLLASHLKGWLPSPMELLQLDRPRCG